MEINVASISLVISIVALIRSFYKDSILKAYVRGIKIEEVKYVTTEPFLKKAKYDTSSIIVEPPGYVFYYEDRIEAYVSDENKVIVIKDIIEIKYTLDSYIKVLYNRFRR